MLCGQVNLNLAWLVFFALPKQGLLSLPLLPQSVMLESRPVMVSLKDAQLFRRAWRNAAIR